MWGWWKKVRHQPPPHTHTHTQGYTQRKFSLSYMSLSNVKLHRCFFGFWILVHWSYIVHQSICFIFFGCLEIPPSALYWPVMFALLVQLCCLDVVVGMLFSAPLCVCVCLQWSVQITWRAGGVGCHPNQRALCRRTRVPPRHPSVSSALSYVPTHTLRPVSSTTARYCSLSDMFWICIWVYVCQREREREWECLSVLLQ